MAELPCSSLGRGAGRIEQATLVLRELCRQEERLAEHHLHTWHSLQEKHPIYSWELAEVSNVAETPLPAQGSALHGHPVLQPLCCLASGPHADATFPCFLGLDQRKNPCR